MALPPRERWYPFEEGRSIGGAGTEAGIIVCDEEHGLGARITLERDGWVAPFAITRGIYGWMFHTRFFAAEAEARQALEAMKPELVRILDLIPFSADPEVERKVAGVGEAMSAFTDAFP